MNLLAPPVPLTRRQITIFTAVALVCAASRFLAMASSIWGWDEALFCLGMREYDVSRHHPHPPGFPMYIAMAKLARLGAPNDFRALQSVNLIAGMLLFPAVFLLARELRFRFETATIAAALCAFFPNVWFFGGTALSDVPSIVLASLAAALLLRGCRNSEAYLGGTLLLAVAIGVRPQNVLIGLVPGIIATWYRAKSSWRDVLFAAILGAAVVGAAFWFAADATGGLQRYAASVREHGEYITRVDSFRSLTRPALWRLVDRFFLLQYQSRPLSILTSIFVLIGVVTAFRNRDRSVLLAILTFAPVALLTWLMLDRFSVNRFSIGYAPLFALLAAAGIANVADRFRRLWLEPAVATALIAAFVVWTWPALAPVRNESSPPVRAVHATASLFDAAPPYADLYVGFSMVAFVDYLAPQLQYVRLAEERGLPLSDGTRPAYMLAEARGAGFAQDAKLFCREPGHLWSITHHYYYDVVLRPLRGRARFVSGWQPARREGQQERRRMSGTSITELPTVNGPAKLRLSFRSDGTSTVTITLNDRVLDRLTPSPSFVDRGYDVTGYEKNVLRIDVHPRQRALELTALVWGPRRR